MSNVVIDRGSCTVRALSKVANISFSESTVIATLAGRIRSRGFHSEKLINEAKKHGFNFKKMNIAKKTVRKFAESYPEGRYYLEKRGHAFAFIDGKCSDGTKPRAIVLKAWKLVV